MAYQALYRSWRSQRFSDIVGQQTVTQTLKNAISQNKTSHAYLFTGPRGTGKTSAAKIFAKAINCPNQVDGEPCNACHICQEITEGRLNDVIEIDAASNNGVDEIREIREKVKYAPTQATYKVYIIDEVHMLSTGAFNALLKTLEEPPANVLFILATTEVHKIPATIISRTQRFDFKRITTEDIVEHLTYILGELGVTFEEQALYVIARAAEGGMRDALSLLDQALSFGEGHLTDADALQVTGSLTHDMMDAYLNYCVEGQVEPALQAVSDILAQGKEVGRFIEDILLYCRDLLVYQQAPEFLKLQRGYLSEAFKQLATKLSTQQLYHYITLLSDTQQQLKMSTHTSIYIEVVTVKLASEAPSVPVSNAPAEIAYDHDALTHLQAQVTELKAALQQLQQTGTTPTPAAPPKPKPSSYRVPTELVYQVLQEATRENLRMAQESWVDLLQVLSVPQRALLKSSEPVAASAKGIVIKFDYEFVCQKASDDPTLKEVIAKSFEKFVQLHLTPVFIPTESWAPLRRDYLQQHPPGEQTTPQEEVVEIDLPEEEVTQEQFVEQAVSFFGEAAVEVVDE